MVKIHGIAYIIVGIVVAGFSYYLMDPRFKIFIWFGLAFIAFGLIRLSIDYLKKPGKHKPAAPQHKTDAIKQPIAKTFCSYCGTALHDFQHFCHNCGKRIFHK